MLIDSTKKTLLLLGNDVFTEDGLFVFLETLDFKIKSFTIDSKNLMMFVDKSLYEELADYERKNDRNKYKRIKGIIDILKVLDIYEDIDTNNFRNFEEFIELQDQLPDFQLGFLTNQANHASYCNLQDGKNVVQIEKFEELQIVPWKFEEMKVVLKEEKKADLKDAFYTKPEDEYVSITKDNETDYVYSEKFGFLRLDKNNVMFGGEGKIYRTYENFLVKIYSDAERRYETIKKIQKIIDMDLRNKYIVWPKDIVYNNNEFVGYIMDEINDAKGLDMYRIYSFNNIAYKERFKICLDLLKLIQYLHDKNILVGDLKFDNVMITDVSRELYIIDSGSFQLEDYSCGVFNADYTHSNLKGKNLRQILRSIEEEYFPINKILFEILMGKGPFYDFISGEVGSEVERKFHYPMEFDKQITNQKNPLFYWTNGDERLRLVFYDYFEKGIITEIDQWIKLLEDILYKGAK